jgi:hypothetical protein
VAEPDGNIGNSPILGVNEQRFIHGKRCTKRLGNGSGFWWNTVKNEPHFQVAPLRRVEFLLMRWAIVLRRTEVQSGRVEGQHEDQYSEESHGLGPVNRKLENRGKQVDNPRD